MHECLLRKLIILNFSGQTVGWISPGSGNDNFFLGVTVFGGSHLDRSLNSSSHRGTCDYLKWVLTAK